MLGASLRFRGVELLRRVYDLEAARSKGSTAGIPLLYPWANRLSRLQYRAAGRQVSLDSSSSRVHFDDHKLPMHGVPWSQLQWNVISSHADALTARLDWSSEELLAIFPFPHHVEMAVRLRPTDLEIKRRCSQIQVRRCRSVSVSIRISAFLESRGRSGR
jgi:aldose 1-epimerase